MDRFNSFTFIFRDGDFEEFSDDDGKKYSLQVSVREVASQMAVHRRNGALGAVLCQLSNTSMTSRLADQVVDYMFDTNEHPTLVQGVLNFCFAVLVKFAYRIEPHYVDARLEAGKKLTLKLAKFVDDGDLPAGLPLI